MATKSVLKNITIRSKKASGRLVSALENAQNKTAKQVEYSHSCKDLGLAEVKKLFGTDDE